MGATRGGATARRAVPAAPPSPGQERPGAAQRFLVALVVTLLLAGLFRQMVASPFRVQTDAMEPALARGDVVMGFKDSTVERGDVITFTTPQGWLAGRSQHGAGGPLAFAGATSVARIVGQPGDEVRCCDRDGRLVVNGISLNGAAEPAPTRFRVVVPLDAFFVRTDDPATGVDSRCFLHSLGPRALVPRTAVRARLATVIWPVWHLGGVRGKPVLTTLPAGQQPVGEILVEASSDVPC